MFTGIIEETGQVLSLTLGSEVGQIELACEKVLEDAKLGDSIAVNGVCLTISKLTGRGFVADVMPQTLRNTNLGKIKRNGIVNLERAMSANMRFGGHIVSGHIDSTGKLIQKKKEKNALWLQIQVKEEIGKYLVERGSVALNGVSLTIAELEEEYLWVSLIPMTMKETNLLSVSIGEEINIETDVIGKYVEKMLHSSKKDSVITEGYLKSLGF